ncbi:MULTISPECIES: glutamate-5-semialdehyde dehydrogenase [Sphingobacterium]|uniref:Gamma-glutamyl phosphate reductase n=1 Tax=Sphingobacterium multivorum TaxID=28454 RepID=A0A2X2JB28_SPHMU|nr:MULTISPECIES: glutamate-5-semialdehyde dehydrogenase [Sphingobacterium]HAE68318.1 glutamate-5-semialdehyde dehydrogenase [Sphingobacterium sp.]OFV17919.1 gamma-glutamyl-phosphate reductase [Sphingobacterium sp. HMSC13C05]OJZ02060.1 MAG: glutamate-5-semialdehyde dehydrogenase [Sphingobacterium sp. 40-24]QQT44016.1 glutamate-5-semialdehyde dehydrogenase [Sphingobacterium multivorum]QQT63232.1 glutamate-5-semialdehyde dehydrogenase [Sphingobacterium multivorum]
MSESILNQLQAAAKAKQILQQLAPDTKITILNAIAEGLIAHTTDVLKANKIDLDRMADDDPKKDRLLLNSDRLKGLADSVKQIAQLADPTDQLLLKKILPNGLEIEKITVPLGVVGVIYESRPNVTIDVAALCIQSGNVCLLRGGSDALHTNEALLKVIHAVLEQYGIATTIVQLLPVDRKHVSELLEATQFVDIIIPRGSQSLIDYVREHAKVPVIETGAGVCHTYVDRTADLDMAAKIVANAKISRPSVCNSLDTVLVDRAVAAEFLTKLKTYFEDAQVEVFADPTAYEVLQGQHFSNLKRADEADFGREFLDLKCSIKTVTSLDEALEHIAKYSSKHSECIVSSSELHIEQFLNTVDAAAVYANASTRFTDGGEFGLGAEIGISTQKLHARGPFALEKLVTEKWIVRGNGQIR